MKFRRTRAMAWMAVSHRREVAARRGKPQPGREIDWAAVRRRLANAAICDGDALTADQAEAVLAQRARVLAAAAMPEVDRGARRDVVVVRIANERYGLAAEHVWRIVGAAPITPVPGAPPILLGVMHLHGEVVAVFDPRPLLGLAADPAGERTRVVVLGAERADLALVVDAADQIVTLAIDQLQPAPDALAPDRRALLHGVMPDGLIVLDGHRLITDPRLTIAPEPADAAMPIQETR